MTAKNKKTEASRRVRQVFERLAGNGRAVSNDALCAMTEKEWRVLRPHLVYLDMPDHLILHHPHETLKYLYFPNSGLISLVVFLQNGRTVEAGIMGREGIVGLPAAMGFPRHPLQEIVQVSGNGFRVSVGKFRELAKRLPEMRKYAACYTTSLGLQVAQTAACNRVHDLEQRLARWLLMAQDRVGADSLAITQDFLATMMGTDRPSVTLAEGLLTRAGAIEHKRGKVKIVDRGVLETCACECYGVILGYAPEVAGGSIRRTVARIRARSASSASVASPGSTAIPVPVAAAK
jgi:CRP-like cAMP-binding protein